MGQCDITVLPEYRRQGLARRLLEQVAAAAREEKRRLLLTNTTDRIPAGESFMLRLGGVRGLVGHTNQLNLDDLDHSLVADWLERGDRSRFELGFWDGDYPEEVLTEVAKLYELTNQQPFDDLDIEEMHMTPEELRQIEANHAARGNQRWTCYVRERQTGRFAGYTDTVWNSNRPRILLQDMTGVFPEFRNHGLGRWLKAAMLNKVLQERPQVKFVRTHNADSNAAMLKINNELGFKPYSADALWQVELEKVQQYLASRTQ
jgi:GNAT superfamily N-acetyltransferase